MELTRKIEMFLPSQCEGTIAQLVERRIDNREFLIRIPQMPHRKLRNFVYITLPVYIGWYTISRWSLPPGEYAMGK